MSPQKRGIGNIDSWVSRRCGSSPLATGTLREYQLSRIRETLAWVREKSPFYRHLLAGINPENLRSASDLSRLPFTTAEDLQKEGHRMLCVSQSDIERIVTLTTSGTTGTSKRIFFTAEDQKRSVDFFKEGMRSFTNPGDRVLILMPGPHPGSIGDLLNQALPAIRAVPIPHGFVTNPMETLAMMEKERINCLIGVPNQISVLAQICKALGRERYRFPGLSKVLLSSDYVSPSLASAVNATWNCETIGYYAMTELGYGGAIECGCHGGYHFYEGDFFLEIIDPDTGAVLPEGMPGEVVITTLSRKGMPFIRYRTGDMSCIIPGMCRCGSPLRRLEAITARKEAVYQLPGGGSLCLAQLDDALFGLPGLLDFHTELSDSEEGISLLLRLNVLGKPQKDGIYKEQLKKIPGIRKALLSGRFRMELHCESYGTEYTPRLGKRKINRVIQNASKNKEIQTNGKIQMQTVRFRD
jgi:phenylacetate-CoA ligase